jgi:hypothetical protein
MNGSYYLSLYYVLLTHTVTYVQGERTGRVGYYKFYVNSKMNRCCDILAQGLIALIEYSYQQIVTSFPEAHSSGASL